MIQNGQPGDKKEIARLRKALEKQKIDLERLRADFTEKDKQLDLANQKIEHMKDEAKHLKESSLKASITQHGLAILTAISLGIGINFFTSPSTATPGIVLIFIGIGTECISFYITYSGVQKNHL